MLSIIFGYGGGGGGGNEDGARANTTFEIETYTLVPGNDFRKNVNNHFDILFSD